MGNTALWFYDRSIYDDALTSGVIEDKQGKLLAEWQEKPNLDIDTIAMIPTYLEIEAGSWEEIDKATQELGLDPKDRKICSAQQIYQIYGINTEEYQTINFDEVIKK